VAELHHRTSRIVEQRPEVVHDRLLELGARLRDEAPPIEPGTQAATLLGISGTVGIEIANRGPNRIDIRTTQGRIRALGAAEIGPADGGRSSLTMGVEIKPQGFAANMMLGVAMKTIPNVEQRVIEALERGLDDLVRELAKPDGEWDAASWVPPGLPRP
jgi:hypothetical protein